MSTPPTNPPADGTLGWFYPDWSTGEWYGPTDMRGAAEAVGVEIRDRDGQPFCCGGAMRMKNGICGTDFCECRRCGVALENHASPHINGGLVFGAGHAPLWFARRPATAGGGE